LKTKNNINSLENIEEETTATKIIT
jgi:hypothetical protein